MFSIALLKNGTFYLISCDHNQQIKRPEFNEVLYYLIYIYIYTDVIIMTPVASQQCCMGLNQVSPVADLA